MFKLYLWSSSTFSSTFENLSFKKCIFGSMLSHIWLFLAMLPSFVFISLSCCSKLERFKSIIPEVFSSNSTSWSNNQYSQIIWNLTAYLVWETQMISDLLEQSWLFLSSPSALQSLFLGERQQHLCWVLGNRAEETGWRTYYRIF